jgi:hypothetical protein
MKGTMIIYRAAGSLADPPIVADIDQELPWLLDRLRDILDDDIEQVPLFDSIVIDGRRQRCVAFCGEHGKLNALPIVNRRARGRERCHRRPRGRSHRQRRIHGEPMTSRKQGSSVRAMVDIHAPPIGLLAKIGSILVHVEEGAGEGGHAFDRMAVRSLLADREVQDWLGGMRDASLLPVKRR